MALQLISILLGSAVQGAAAEVSEEPTLDTILTTKLVRLQNDASANKGIIQIDSHTFDETMALPRNYSLVLLFTAMSSQVQCVACKNFDPEFRLVASSWLGLADKSKLFFGVVDFSTDQSIFQHFDIKSAPTILFFPNADPALSDVEVDRYDYMKRGLQAESFAHWVRARSGAPLVIRRPFDFMSFALNLIGVLVTGVVGHALHSRAGRVFRSKYLWAASSLFIIFIMISGHMWNQIRKPSYSISGRDGQQGFIATGMQNQFGLETQIVAVLYAVLSGSVVSLISSVPRVEDPAKQRATVWLWMGVIGISFNVLLHIFRLKAPHYPYRLYF
ncbi:oligosaccharyl transferase subunit ost3/OST6 [Mortierella claussenii]|nr:oligosaccharyl transferase subunit ost3/OST6 [Mortierella claussenii]